MRKLIVVLMLIMIAFESLSASNRVLVISSYGVDYKWSNVIVQTISQKLKEHYPIVELNVEFMSSEFLNEPELWGEKMNGILSNYRKNPPKAIVLISDEAWMAYRDADLDMFKNTPLVLCAVKPHSISAYNFGKNKNSLQLSNFARTIDVMDQYNATGVLREMNVSGFLLLMNNLINSLDSFTFITDSRFYGVYTNLLLRQEVQRYYADIPVECIDGRFINTDSLLSRLPHISSASGVLMTSWLTGEHGFEYSKDYVYNQMENKLNTPIFITNNIGLEKEYFVGGYFNEASFWGDKTFNMLIDILNEKKPKDITPLIYHDDQCHIAWNVFNYYKLDTKKLPLKVNFYNKPEPFFREYKYYIIAISIGFTIFVIIYLFTIRSNFKLQKTQRLLLKSIDETKKANIELEEVHQNLVVALKKAEESDRLKSAFLANMSHEIRTPLNAIVGFSSVIVDAESEEERSEFAGYIQRNSDLLLQLISDILDISKIEAGTLTLSFTKVDVSSLCTDVINTLQVRCKQGVKLYLNEAITPMTIVTDQNRLMQVLINLVSNATKFTSKGEIELGYFSYNNDLVEFFVRDTGIGIPKEQISNIFGRFIKLDSYVEGSGLGLSICKTIVEMQGGEIGVKSNEGEGSYFWFRIPKRGIQK